MKALNCLLICLTTLAFNSAPGQQTPGVAKTSQIKNEAKAAPPDAPALTRFSLDFPGGTPRELATAIQKATGKPLNAIVPDEFAATKLPALKMNDVDVSQLFQALEATSRRSVAYVTSTYYGGGYAGGPSSSYSTSQTSYGFRTEGNLSDDSIWYFYVSKPAFPPMVSSGKVCRFYALAPYLDRGLKVDDITTAIQTAWKMMGDNDAAAISFHKDTKLLIAAGDPDKLQTIEAVLKALEQPPVTFVVPPGAVKAAAAPKADQ